MSATTPLEIANRPQPFNVLHWKGLAVLLFGMLMGINTAYAQATPDSTSTQSGKDSLKKSIFIGAPDSSLVGDPVVLYPVVGIGKDTLPTDTTIGPLSKAERRDQRQMARFKKHEALGLPDPKIAVRRSLILPGMGQAYNRSWWKIPIVYAGFGAFGYLIASNHKQYKFFREVALCKNDSNPSCDDAVVFPEYADFDITSIISERDDYRRLRDLNVIFTCLWYTLQTVDAFVDAHLKGFNVSDDLTMHVNPTLNIDPFRQSRMYMGATLSFRLR